MVNRKREDEIRQAVAELAASGETVAGFARRRGIEAWKLYEWRRRNSGSAKKSRSKPSRRRGATVEPPSFVAVKLGEPGAPTGFELTIGSMKISVPPGFDANELLRLLKVVASC